MLAVCLLLFIPELVPYNSVFSGPGLIAVGAHLGFVQGFFARTFLTWEVMPQAWTLTVEMCFYLALPLLAIGFLRWRWLLALPGRCG